MESPRRFTVVQGEWRMPFGAPGPLRRIIAADPYIFAPEPSLTFFAYNGAPTDVLTELVRRVSERLVSTGLVALPPRAIELALLYGIK